MSEVISSFRSLRAGSRVFVLLMLFLCVILHTMSSGKRLPLLCILPFGMMFVKIPLAVCIHNVNVAVIQESKLSSNSKTPSIQNITTVRKDQGGGLLTLIHKSINFSRKPWELHSPHIQQ